MESEVFETILKTLETFKEKAEEYDSRELIEDIRTFLKYLPIKEICRLMYEKWGIPPSELEPVVRQIEASGTASWGTPRASASAQAVDVDEA